MKDSWKVCELGSVTSLITKGTTPTSLGYDFEESGVNFVKVESITKSGKFLKDKFNYISKDANKALNRSQLNEDDILFSIAGVIGRVAVVDKSILPANTNQALAIIRLRNEVEINNSYLSNYLKSEKNQQQINRISVQLAQANFSLTDLSILKIDYPPLPQQQKIAKILSTCDAVIEKTEAAIAKYQALKQGMMHDLFTRGIDTKTGKLRPKQTDAPELYKESELGWIPKEWEVKKLEEITIKIGDGIHSTPKYIDNSEYYFINGNNLNNGSIEITSNTNCVSFEEYKKHKMNLSENTILYSINGTIGNIAIYGKEEVVLGKSAGYFCFCSSELMLYIYFVLQTEATKKFYNLEQTGSTISNLSIKALRITPAPLPIEIEYRIITEKLQSINNRIKTEQSTLSKYKQIKSGLMQDLLSGKVEVKI